MRRFLSLLLHLFGSGQGRPAAAVLLAAFIALSLLQERSPLAPLRLASFDAYQILFPRTRESAPAVIVAIDEAAIRQYGQWPWPRTLLAELISRISSCGPAAIGVDILMPEPDRVSPARLAETLPQLDRELRRRLKALPDNDQMLASVLRSSKVVLGFAGIDAPGEGKSAAPRTAPMLSKGGDPLHHVRYFPAALTSVPELEDGAAGQALLSADPEKGIVRRIPLLASVGVTLVPALAPELLRVAAGLPAIEVDAGPDGVFGVRVGDVRIPTQANGEAWIHLTPFLPERYLSAADLLKGTVAPEQLRQKLVLVGMTGLGLVDYHTTARGERVPGMELHAQLLENIFDGRFLRRPGGMTGLEIALSALLGLGLIVVIPTLKPSTTAGLTLILTLLTVGCGVALYRAAGLLFDAATLAAEVNLLSVSLSLSGFIETDRRKRLAERQLQLEREAAARVAGELEAARRIQMGSLPLAAAVFSDESRFEIDAFLKPARQVGGDLYDFFRLDENRVFFMIGDVSGKGLPACLFMVMIKTLAKSIVMESREDLRATLNRINREMARDNPETLFVTAFVAVFDAASGYLDYGIAGHDAPWRISASGAMSRLEGEGNLPLCVEEGRDYPLFRLQFAPGDTLCVVTDGVTEAMNAAKELYGKGRLERLLAAEAPLPSPTELIARVHGDVAAFTGDAEQSDDLAILALRWRGRG